MVGRLLFDQVEVNPKRCGADRHGNTLISKWENNVKTSQFCLLLK